GVGRPARIELVEPTCLHGPWRPVLGRWASHSTGLKPERDTHHPESHDEDEQPEADDCEACPLRWLYRAVAKVAQLGRPGEIVALLHRFPLCAAVVAARRWCDVTHTTILVSFSMLAQALVGKIMIGS